MRKRKPCECFDCFGCDSQFGGLPVINLPSDNRHVLPETNEIMLSLMKNYDSHCFSLPNKALSEVVSLTRRE